MPHSMTHLQQQNCLPVNQVICGNNLDVMANWPSNSVQAIICDPPYAFPGGFMGKKWDNHDGREDAGFGYWLAGFTDGEGCFRVQRHERGTHTCTFGIKVRLDDSAVIERIKCFVGYGTITKCKGSGNASDLIKYCVQDKEGCEAIVGLFRKYPLTAKKALDFEIWAEAVGEWANRPRGNRWKGQAPQERAASLKSRLENVRKYTDVPWSGHRFQDWVRIWATECLRVAKPGAYLLASGAPRTYHRLACGIEDAGWEIRDCISHIFGQGFPKSHNIEKAIAKTDTETAKQWAGFGTALKPAYEPWVLARKPLDGTVANNVLAHGTGGLNIDGCRIPAEPGDGPAGTRTRGSFVNAYEASKTNWGSGDTSQPHDAGRFPANLCLSYPEEEYELRDDVSPDQLRQLAEWMDANT